jgi:hypothetical protein
LEFGLAILIPKKVYRNATSKKKNSTMAAVEDGGKEG